MPSDGEQIAGTFIEEGGREVNVTVEAVNAEIESAISAVTFGEGAGDELRVEEREPDGLLRLRVKLFEEDAGKDGLMLGTINSDGGALMLTPGPVWYLPKAEGAPHGVLMVDSMDRLQPVEGEPLEKRVEPATGGHRPDRIAIHLDGEPLGIGSLIFAVAFVRGALAAYEKMGAERAAGAGLELPRQDTKKPRQHYAPNTKLANKIAEPLIYEAGGVLLDVASAREKRRGKEVTEAVSISLDAEGVNISRPMTPYDGDVHSAAATLFVAGNSYITSAQVCQTLTGSKKPTPKQIAEVEESLDRQMRAYVRIDLTDEARGRSLKYDGSTVTDFKVEGYMLQAEKVSIRTANGRAVDGYKLLAPPILYRHAAMLGQVVSYPQRMLETDSAGSNTKQRTVIKSYMARRIGQIKGRGKVSPRIRLETVYEKAGVDAENNDKRKDTNRYVEQLLKLWKGSGIIKGYRKVTEGPKRKVVAFDIAV